MGRLYKAVCSQCGEIFRARSRTKLLQKVRKHIWKEHAGWMKRRIKAGRQASLDNPSEQDLITALTEGPRSAIRVYKRMTEIQYRHMKRVMDAIETLLPVEARVAWKAVEAIHDELR